MILSEALAELERVKRERDRLRYKCEQLEASFFDHKSNITSPVSKLNLFESLVTSSFTFSLLLENGDKWEGTVDVTYAKGCEINPQNLQLKNVVHHNNKGEMQLYNGVSQLINGMLIGSLLPEIRKCIA
jgi:hypothetical protein